MATFRYRIPNFAGGDSMPPPIYEVHSTEDILNTNEMKYMQSHPEHIKFYTRELTWYKNEFAHTTGKEIMDQHKGNKYGYVRGVVYDLDFDLTLDDNPDLIE